MRTPSQPLLLGCGCCKSRYGVFERPWHPPHGPLGDFEAARRRGAGRLTTPIQEWAAERGFECLPVHSGTLKPWATGNGPGGGRPSPKLLNTREGGILGENPGAPITRCLTADRAAEARDGPQGMQNPKGRELTNDEADALLAATWAWAQAGEAGCRASGPAMRSPPPSSASSGRRGRRWTGQWGPGGDRIRAGSRSPVRSGQDCRFVLPWSRWSAVQRRAYIMGGRMPGAEGKHPPELAFTRGV